MSRVYFARPVWMFEDGANGPMLDALHLWFDEVYDPNTPEGQAGYSARGMAFCLEQVAGCDSLAYRLCDDGRVAPGVAAEVLSAQVQGKMLYEVRMVAGRPSLGFQPYFFPAVMPVKEARERIAGVRKG